MRIEGIKGEKMNELLVSVIIPVYNVEQYLKQCVDSVLNQTYQKIEVILVDDGSPDKCPEICDLYAKTDSRVRVLHQENAGLSEARNAGIQASSGEYIIFLDSDDFWDDKNALKRIVDRLKKTNPDVLNCSYKKYYEDTGIQISRFDNCLAMPDELKKKSEQLDYLTKEFLYIASACNKIIRTDILKKYMKFQKGKLSEDVEWCARLLYYAQSFDFVCEEFYCYRQRAMSITHTMKEKSCIDLTDNILECIRIAEKADKETKEYIYRYTAYQLSTFVAVQAIATKCPPECIERLKKYAWLFSYHGKNKKVTCLYVANKILGFKNMCRIVRWSKKVWS